jgi:hypothetical protein
MIGIDMGAMTLQMVCMLAWKQARSSAPETLQVTVPVEATTGMARTRTANCTAIELGI